MKENTLTQEKQAIMGMMYRRRRFCIFLLVGAILGACSLMFQPHHMRATFFDYRTQVDGETRRLLESGSQKSQQAVVNKVAKVVKDVKRSDDAKYRVPIFWDDGEFMDADDTIIEEENDRYTEHNDVSNTDTKSDTRNEMVQEKEPAEPDRTMSVLDYKLSQFQTVKYSNNSVNKKADGGEGGDTSRVLPVHLLIVTQRRSGSSFLGQIFNQNPWVFFHFEPLKLLEFKKGVYPNASSLLGNMLKCRFDRTPYLLDLYNNETLHRMSSKVLCTPPLCRTNVDYNDIKPATARKCGRLKRELVTNVCNTYPHQVVKMIRLYNLESLGPLLSDKDLNVKVVHLLRDPRGTLSSRAREHADKAKPLSLGTSLDHDAAYICRRMRLNFKYVNENEELFKNRYLRIRYEDMASNPESWTRTLYRFAGMGDVPVDVFNWIQANTQGSSPDEVKDTYSTHRNSSATAQAWRHNIDFPVVQAIQRFCKDVLTEAGYVEIKHASDLERTDMDLVKPIR